MFSTMPEARAVLAAWTSDDNKDRPHTSLGGLTPLTFAREQKRLRVQRSRPASPELRKGSAQQALTTAHQPRIVGPMRSSA